MPHASPFLALAERHDLDYAERVAPGAAGRFPLPRGETTELVGGRLPGGFEGLAGRLRRTDDDPGEEAELALVVTRIPESTGFARYITCSAAGFSGVLRRAIGPGGLGWIRDFAFESIEFNRRYKVTMLRSGKEIRLRQLFSPVFVDWMADTAPDGLYFDLISGVLTVTLAGGSLEGAADVERACALAGHVAERIRSEALEGEGLGDGSDPQAQAAWAAAEAEQAERIQRAGITSSATDVASAAKGLRAVIRGEKGFLRRLLGSGDDIEATMLALTAMTRSYADRNGLDYDQPDSLVELLPFLDHFPIPVMRQLSMHGELPEARAAGDLVAFFDLSSPGSRGGLRCRPALEVEVGDAEGGFVHVLPLGERDATAPSAIGGFSIALGGGTRRETEQTKRNRELVARTAESLGGRFGVVADPRAGEPPIGKAAEAWLADDAGRALVREGGRLTLLGASRPPIEWSFGTLDEFCRSVAPVVEEAEAPTE